MKIVLQQIEHKTSKDDKPFVRAKATPGGWMSIWDPALIALVKEHGSGPYEAEVKEDGDFKNISVLTLAVRSQENGHTPGQFRDPPQIIRTDALRMAQDTIVALGMPGDDFEHFVLATARVYAAYIADGTIPDKATKRQMEQTEPSHSQRSRPVPPQTQAGDTLLETPMQRKARLQQAVGWGDAEFIAWCKTRLDVQKLIEGATRFSEVVPLHQSSILDLLEKHLREIGLLPDQEKERSTQ